MGVMIDIIGSTIIRGAIVLVILNLNINLNNALSQKTVRAALKQKMVVPAQILTDDIRLAGYNQTGTKYFPLADTSKIMFYADVDNNGVQDLVYYFLGTPDPISKHQVLYRQLNAGQNFALVRDVISLRFTYYKRDGSTFTSLPASGLSDSTIKSISIKLTIESNIQAIEGIGTDNTASYQTAYWERTIFPQNL